MVQLPAHAIEVNASPQNLNTEPWCSEQSISDKELRRIMCLKPISYISVLTSAVGNNIDSIGVISWI
jgi:hypothetical protein